MSGTSLDGVDCALCLCRRGDVELIRVWSARFPTALARRLRATAGGQSTAWECGQLHHDLGRFYARVIADGLGTERADAVGLHGQTVFHQPKHPAATWQIGEPAWVAERMGIPVISNFRTADLAAGGQGAPLATLFHQVVFARPGLWTAVQNLGGIGNVTAIDASNRSEPPRILSFDTGPANMLLDLATRRVTGGRLAYDQGGRRASRGRVDEVRLARWLQHPFFRRRPPKSTGREQFGEAFLETIVADWPEAMADRGQHLLATLTEFTARSIAENYRLHLPVPSGTVGGRVILTGGGAANVHLTRRIGAWIRGSHPGVELLTSDALGWPHEAIEPAAFALLAAYRLWGLPGNLPATTGAAGPRLLGQITASVPGGPLSSMGSAAPPEGWRPTAGVISSGAVPNSR
jgi:anhydro-N-acetylmuramic acid kinase